MNASDHLDGLARALTAAGWPTPARYGNVPAVLLVFASGRSVGVSVKAGTGGVPWFVSSNQDPLRPCHDLAGTVVEIEARLGTSATLSVRPARRRVLGRLGKLRRPFG
ncbi:hypothetical protein [Actinomadura sp. BRA 177]|uniref:hypothetical protein n=1 Tax=Actinomadura sp. BRA 177 TaxID=2745202 RepID=UPI001595C0DA|nr:hypothetical protein [Actinomadura sp. BRA 177]NVI89947.1 hypothetical protein [Actinomadura sp. BRA 177]